MTGCEDKATRTDYPKAKGKEKPAGKQALMRERGKKVCSGVSAMNEARASRIFSFSEQIDRSTTGKIILKSFPKQSAIEYTTKEAI